MDRWFTHSYDSFLANRATTDRALQMMTLPTYYKKSPLRRAFCHLLPMTFALCIGAFAIMVLDHNLPQEVIWGKIIPPTVLPGQPVTFHFGLKKYTEYGGTIKRWVTDVHEQVFSLSDSPTVSDQVKEYGVEQEITKGFTVPCGMGTGFAMYHSTAYLHSWWNIVQRIFPVSHDFEYPFTVTAGRFDDACSLVGGGQQGVQGEPGAPGAPGGALPRARIIHKVWLEPTVMKAGSKFTVNFDVTINQVCPGETHWSLVRISDGMEVAKIIQPTRPTVLGFNHLTNTRMLPVDLPPGEYYYTATIYEFCGPERTTYMAATEHIPFTVH
jgi:hypothetical protein